jgi:hypothetical protein
MPIFAVAFFIIYACGKSAKQPYAKIRRVFLISGFIGISTKTTDCDLSMA